MTDLCIKCGSDDIIENSIKEFTLELPNPGTISVMQACNECRDCNETYYTEEQASELSNKIEIERSR